MKRFVLTLLLLTMAPAYAADPAPRTGPTSCGKTADECQKIVDTLNDQIADLRAAYTLARQQRNNALGNPSDAEITQVIQQQQAARQQKR